MPLFIRTNLTWKQIFVGLLTFNLAVSIIMFLLDVFLDVNPGKAPWETFVAAFLIVFIIEGMTIGFPFFFHAQAQSEAAIIKNQMKGGMEN